MPPANQEEEAFVSRHAKAAPVAQLDLGAQFMAHPFQSAYDEYLMESLTQPTGFLNSLKQMKQQFMATTQSHSSLAESSAALPSIGLQLETLRPHTKAMEVGDDPAVFAGHAEAFVASRDTPNHRQTSRTSETGEQSLASDVDTGTVPPTVSLEAGQNRALDSSHEEGSVSLMESDDVDAADSDRSHGDKGASHDDIGFLSLDQGAIHDADWGTTDQFLQRSNPFQARIDRLHKLQEMSREDRLSLLDDAIDQMVIYPRTPPWFLKSCPDIGAKVRRLGFYVDPYLDSILQREISDFVAMFAPTSVERKMRAYLICRIEAIVQSLWPAAEVDCFGSFGANLYLPSSDLDLQVRNVPHREWNTGLHVLKSKLSKSGLVFGSSVQVIKARVSLVKFVDATTQFSVDISFQDQSSTAMRAVQFTRNLLKEQPALRPLMIVLKQFLLMRGLNEVYTGGLGSFGLVLMLSSFLRLHSKLYGKRFNYDQVGIDAVSGYYFPKEKSPQNDRLSILDPNDPSNDITRGSFNLRVIRGAFSHAYDTMCAAFYEIRLRHRSEESTKKSSTKSNPLFRVFSILGTIVDVPESFLAHREHVEDAYQRMQPLVEEALTVTPLALELNCLQLKWCPSQTRPRHPLSSPGAPPKTSKKKKKKNTAVPAKSKKQRKKAAADKAATTAGMKRSGSGPPQKPGATKKRKINSSSSFKP